MLQYINQCSHFCFCWCKFHLYHDLSLHLHPLPCCMVFAQANTEEELPEFLLGTCRLNHLDAAKAVLLKPSSRLSSSSQGPVRNQFIYKQQSTGIELCVCKNDSLIQSKLKLAPGSGSSISYAAMVNQALYRYVFNSALFFIQIIYLVYFMIAMNPRSSSPHLIAKREKRMIK